MPLLLKLRSRAWHSTSVVPCCRCPRSSRRRDCRGPEVGCQLVAAVAQDQLASLMDIVDLTEPHFVRQGLQLVSNDEVLKSHAQKGSGPVSESGVRV